MLTLDTKINKLYGVGEKIAGRLKKLDLNTLEDLLFYWPFRYDDYSHISPISSLKPNIITNIVGTIELIQNKRSPRKRINITEALVSDETESIKIVWFNQPFIAKTLKVGDKISLAGKVTDDYGGLQMQSPTYEKIQTSPNPSLVRKGNIESVHTQGLVPNYHLTLNITQKQLRYTISQIINLADKISDWLPKEIKKSQNLLDLNIAIKKIHFPKNQKDIDTAKKRLAFNELFLLQIQSQLIKNEIKNLISEPVKFFEKETKKFVDTLPFKLTNAQRKASWEIIQDIDKKKPMTRLLEGDVGSGKTLVAVIALLNTALNQKQAVLMVPTEILAKQHFELITKILKGFDINIGLITRSDKKINKDVKNKKKINSSIIIDNSQIIIGTHSLIQEDIRFNNLALVIIDEQHRFGVDQRKKLTEKTKDKNNNPHLLSMTATPIPRSLALALYGDLDISIINEMPKGRKKIITKVVDERNRSKAYEFIYKKIKNNRQVFVICPLIDISDPLRLAESEASKLGIKSVKEEYEKLNNNIFPDLKIEMLHGKLKSVEKEKIMKDFLDNKTKILVSTSVIEVGVDIPNATTIMIEGADRFGLAQLHQFRGRVGRSDHQSYCFLFTDNSSPKTIDRLNAMIKYDNGFDLAKADLKYRGPGEVYGTAQKGFPELRLASLFDYELMKIAQTEAINLIKKDKNLKNSPILKEKINYLNKNIHLE